MRGFLLGLSSGAVCLTVCAPILVPYLLAEAKAVRSDFGSLGAFLAGRLVGYIGFAVLAWSVGALLHRAVSSFALLVSLVYVLLGAIMVLYGLIRPRSTCAAAGAGRLLRSRVFAKPPLFPALLGLLTGLNLCPPFLLAFTEAANSRSLSGSVLFFLAFFFGTSLLFLPFPMLGALRRFPSVQAVGRLASIVVGAIYCVMGLNMIR